MQEKTQWMKYYLEYCQKQKNLNDKTIKAYRIDLRQYIDFLDSRDLEITVQSVRTYVMILHDNYQVRSIKRKIASIKAWSNFLLENQLIEENPFYHWHIRLRQPAILPRTIPLRVIEAILRTAHNETQKATTITEKRQAWRETAVLELLFATGCKCQ